MGASHSSIGLTDLALLLAALASAGALAFGLYTRRHLRRQISHTFRIPDRSARAASPAPGKRFRQIAPETVRSSEAPTSPHSLRDATIRELEQAFAQYGRGRLSISSYCEVVALVIERLEASHGHRFHMPDFAAHGDDLADAIDAARWCLDWGQAQLALAAVAPGGGQSGTAVQKRLAAG